MEFQVRDAVPGDVAETTRIYNALLASTTIEWTEDPHTEADRLRWQEQQQTAGHPVLVAESATGSIAGWGSYAEFRDNERWPGYRFTVEHSIHVDEPYWGRGVGRILVESLADRARRAGIHVMVAGIDGDNVESIRFHDRLGFEKVGHLREIGFKHGRWLDLVFMQRVLAPESEMRSRMS